MFSSEAAIRTRVHSIESSSDEASLFQGLSLELLSSPTIHNPVRRRFAELADECDEIPATALLSAQDLRATGMRDDNKWRPIPISIGQIRFQTLVPIWNAD